jgi:hypothetical protein
MVDILVQADRPACMTVYKYWEHALGIAATVRSCTAAWQCSQTVACARVAAVHTVAGWPSCSAVLVSLQRQ